MFSVNLMYVFLVYIKLILAEKRTDFDLDLEYI